MTPEQFWRRVIVRDEDQCWIFRSFGASRYPTVNDESGRHITAHKFAYEDRVGPVPEGHDVHHLCEVKRCVNPRHLEAKSKADHARDHILARS